MKICIINPPSLHGVFDSSIASPPSVTLVHLGGALTVSEHEFMLIDAKLEALGAEAVAIKNARYMDAMRFFGRYWKDGCVFSGKP